jgi:hypothetical protein
MIIYSLGSALPVFMTTLINENAQSNLEDVLYAEKFSLVKMVDAGGYLIGVPVMTSCWVAGIDRGGAYLGTPYFLAGVSFRASLKLTC